MRTDEMTTTERDDDRIAAELALAGNGRGDIHVLDVLIVLARNKERIFRWTAVAAVLAVVISLLLPNVYVATARLLPPLPNSSSLSVMLGQLGSLANLVGGAGGGDLTLRNPNDTYVAILRSRSVFDGVIARTGLQQRWNKKTLTDTRMALEKNVSFTTNKEGVIVVDVEDTDPKMAAAIANAFVAEMKRVAGSLNITEAGQRRAFFEAELAKAREKLAQSEEQLKQVQERLGVIELGTQVRAAIGTEAELQARISAAEVELQVARTYGTENNPRVIELKQAVSALRGRLAALQRGSNDGRGKLPANALEYADKLREMKFNEEIIGVLVRQYEAARIDEANNLAVIQVLDEAAVPERKSKPFRSLIVVVATMLAFLFACGWVFVAEGLRRARLSPEDEARLALLRRQVRWDRSSLKFWQKR